MAEKPKQDDIVRNVRIGLAISFGALLIVLLITGLYVFIAPYTATEKKEFVQIIAVLLAGLAGLIGLYFTWQNTRTNQKTLLHNQNTLEANQRNTQSTLELTERGQITERFTRAIEQLGETNDKGEPKLEIRLGGIYALERIARDSPEYYSTVMEVLTAYVRENAPWPLKGTSKSTSDEDVERNEGVEQGSASSATTPSADIQAILDVIGRREEDRVPQRVLLRIDLRRTNLQGAHLTKANLKKARLFGSNLQRTRLQEAALDEADIEKAELQGADLRGAHLPKAHLQGANLQGANLQGANLQGANLEEAYLNGADLGGGDILGWSPGAEFDPVYETLHSTISNGLSLKEAESELGSSASPQDLRRWEAKLEEIRNGGAKLRGAQLQGADLERASLVYADLREAVFTPYAQVAGANFWGAQLQGADLLLANGLSQQQIDHAIVDATTKLPDYVHPGS